MRQLKGEVLDAKIASFMQARLSEHPELKDEVRVKQTNHTLTAVVSRAKDWGEKISPNYSVNNTFYRV